MDFGFYRRFSDSRIDSSIFEFRLGACRPNRLPRVGLQRQFSDMQSVCPAAGCPTATTSNTGQPCRSSRWRLSIHGCWCYECGLRGRGLRRHPQLGPDCDQQQREQSVDLLGRGRKRPQAEILSGPEAMKSIQSLESKRNALRHREESAHVRKPTAAYRIRQLEVQISNLASCAKSPLQSGPPPVAVKSSWLPTLAGLAATQRTGLYAGRSRFQRTNPLLNELELLGCLIKADAASSEKANT